MESLSYIEISKSNLLRNLKSFQSYLSPHTKIVSVVKANTYGHGEEEIVKILSPVTDYFQVDDLLELRSLRIKTKKEILVLGYVAHHELKKAVELKAILGIYDIERLKILESIGKKSRIKPRVHIKIDAYLGRQGVPLDEIDSFISYLKKLKYVQIEGVYSHFSNIEDTASFSHAKKQANAYHAVLKKFNQAGFTNLLTHISATSGVLRYEQRKGLHSLARIGIGLYGLWPSDELKKKYKSKITLKPVMRWITHVAQIKTLPANYPIGYGLTYVTSRPTKVAVIPQGYADGYDRSLSNLGEVLIRGKRCKVLGRVAMNMFMVDASRVRSVKQEDEVVLLGRQKGEEITAEEIADKIGTINYEVTTRVSPLLPRVVV